MIPEEGTGPRNICHWLCMALCRCFACAYPEDKNEDPATYAIRKRVLDKHRAEMILASFEETVVYEAAITPPPSSQHRQAFQFHHVDLDHGADVPVVSLQY